jgi:TonB family protein
MSRLQKKCFAASAGFHLLLLLVLLVGPAFLSSRNNLDNLPVINFVPFKTVDAMVSGGGNPQAQPPPPAPPAPPPSPKPTAAPPVVKPEPAPKETVKEVKPDSDAIEPSKEKKSRIEISTKIVTRNPRDLADAKARAETRDREIAEARRRAAAEIGQVVSGIKSGLSQSTRIDMDFGPGGGGPTYANFNAALKSIYERAWIVPNGIADKDASVIVSVTIARDGTVISGRITQPSGNALVDRSVQQMLERVKFAVALPEDAPEEQRTVSFKLNVEAKLLG